MSESSKTSSARKRPAAMTLRRMPEQGRAKETLQAILDAAERLLEEEGIGAITMAKIAEHGNVSAGTIYLYFRNKNAVLYGLLERWLGLVNEVIAQHDVTHRQFANWMEWIDSLIEAIQAIYEREPGLAAHYDAVIAIPQLRARDAEQDRHVIDWSAASIRHFLPDAREEDVEIAATLSLTIVHHVLRHAVNQPDAKKRKMVRSLRAMAYALITNVSS